MSKRRIKSALVASACAGLLAVGVVAAPPATALLGLPLPLPAPEASPTKVPVSVLNALGPTGSAVNDVLNAALGNVNVKLGGSPEVTEMRSITQPSGACQSTQAPNGLLYIEELLAGKVGVYNPVTKEQHEITVGPRGAGTGIPRYIDGAMWVPNTVTSTLARIDLQTEEVKIYQLDLPPGSFSDDIAKGTDGMYYLSATTFNVISEFDPNTGKTVQNIPVPGLTPGGPGAPFTIVNGAGDDLWTNGIVGNDIIKFNAKTHAFTLYPVPTPLAGPDVTILGPNGSVWFSEMTGNKIGTLDPATGAITEYPLPNAVGTAFDIQWNGQTGSNAAMIIADIVGNKMLRFDLSTKTFTQNYTIPTLASAPCATGFTNGVVYTGELAGGNVAMIPDHN